jgi:uncharacterized repeat protein (TIGR04076 family)
MDERMWRIMQWRLGYDDEEMAAFRQDPRNADVVSKAGALLETTLVAEVVDAHGCNSRHKEGDRLFFDGAGNLITKKGPDRICVHLLSAASTLILAANELFYAGVDPNEMRFNRAGCIDVGVACGGWGRVVIELRAEPREAD